MRRFTREVFDTAHKLTLLSFANQNLGKLEMTNLPS